MIDKYVNIGPGVSLGVLGIGGGQDGPFAIIWKGAPTDYTSYTRLDVGYSSNPSGVTYARQTDEYLSEYDAGVKLFDQYEGTNKCECDGIPTDSTTGLTVFGDAAPITIVTDDNGTAWYELDNSESEILSVVTVAGFSLNTNPHSLSIHGYLVSGVSGTLEWSSGAGETVFTNTIPQRVTLIDSSPDASRNLTIKADIGAVLRFRLPQLTETPILLPDIPSSKDGQVTVNKGTTKILATDIDTACYNFDSAESDTITFPCTIDQEWDIEIDYKPSGAHTHTLFYKGVGGATDTDITLDYDKPTRAVRAFYYNTSGSGVVLSRLLTASQDVDGFKLRYTKIGPVSTVFADGVAIDTDSDSTPVHNRSSVAVIGARASTSYLNGLTHSLSVKDAVGGTTLIDATMSEFRKDTLVKNYGALGDGTASRTVDNLYTSNAGFGYPVDEKAPIIDTITTSDGVTQQKGLKELFSGMMDCLSIDLPQTGLSFDPSFVVGDSNIVTMYADGEYSELADPPAKVYTVDEARVNSVNFDKPLDIFTFQVSSCSLTGGIPPESYKLKNLSYYRAYNNPALGGELSPKMWGFSKLRYWEVDTCGLTGLIPPFPEDLPNIDTMQHFQIPANDISGVIPSRIASFADLTTIWMYSNNFSGTDLSNFVTALWNNRLVLGGNNCSIKLENNNGLTADAIARIEGTGIYLGDGLKDAGCTVTY